jgi:hypothetical protein
MPVLYPADGTNIKNIVQADIDPAVDVLPGVDVSANQTVIATVEAWVNAASPKRLDIAAALDTTLRNVQDNAVSPTPSQLYLATDKSAIAGSLSIGKSTAPDAVADVKGSGTTAGTTAMHVRNANNFTLLKLLDNGNGQLGDVNNQATFQMYNQIFFNFGFYTPSIGVLYGGLPSVDFIDYNGAIQAKFLNAAAGGVNRILMSDYNTFTGNGSACLELNSISRGFLPPRLTTNQKNNIVSPQGGLMVFDTDLKKYCLYSGTAWETITST